MNEIKDPIILVSSGHHASLWKRLRQAILYVVTGSWEVDRARYSCNGHSVVWFRKDDVEVLRQFYLALVKNRNDAQQNSLTLLQRIAQNNQTGVAVMRVHPEDLFVFPAKQSVLIRLPSFEWQFRLGAHVVLRSNKHAVRLKQVGTGNHEGRATILLTSSEFWPKVEPILFQMKESQFDLELVPTLVMVTQTA